ncbi:MAG: putative glycoside hydrolase [Firmicutes bacterium]|nr:putative glycoside hydrolase [Bacillota bacterium]
MLRIPYRNKLLLKKLLRVVLILLAALLVLSLVLLLYYEPYIVYDRDGAHLRLSTDSGQAAVPEAAPRPTVENPLIVYDTNVPTQKSLAETGGYYITTAMLQDPEAVFDAVKKLEEPCAVMIELKSIFGNFYYSTSIGGAQTADVDIAKIDQLLTYLVDKDFYLIAVVPAFSDRAFALENQSCGLPLSSGALWMDDYGCYWLDPANETVKSYLMQIARELSGLGVREVVFSEFRFPESSSIVYSSDQTSTEILRETASELTSFFTGSNLMISFETEAADFPADACKGRLYIPNVDGSQVERYVQLYGKSEGLAELVFLAASRDTRFENQAVLRPLLSE